VPSPAQVSDLPVAAYVEIVVLDAQNANFEAHAFTVQIKR
jgi:hypothetical protein